MVVGGKEAAGRRKSLRLRAVFYVFAFRGWGEGSIRVTVDHYHIGPQLSLLVANRVVCLPFRFNFISVLRALALPWVPLQRRVVRVIHLLYRRRIPLLLPATGHALAPCTSRNLETDPTSAERARRCMFPPRVGFGPIIPLPRGMPIPGTRWLRKYNDLHTPRFEDQL